jgi:hypothetical protein
MTARPILTLAKQAPPEETSAALPPRPPKQEGAPEQLLSFIIVDRKPHHHATYEAASTERDYLQAYADQDPKQRKGRWIRGPQSFRVMKILNLSGAELVGKVVIADPGKVDDIALEAACAAWGETRNGAAALCSNGERDALRAAVLTYLDALEPIR